MSDMLCYAHSGIVTGHVDLGWSGMLMGRVTQAASPTIYGMATVNSKCRQAVCVCVCVCMYVCVCRHFHQCCTEGYSEF